ncbi:MAG: FKBP-type peptidyl-prolyl cis-trans isomerase [Mariprofundaceae bacterium]
MKKMIWALVAAGLMAGCQGEKGAENKGATGEIDLSGDEAKLGYAIGLDVGKSLKTLGASIDMAAFKAAVDDRMAGREPRIPEAEAAKIKQAFFMKRAQKQMQERKAQGEKNKAASEQFLAGNAKKEGVKVTASGLQYKVLKMGDGPKPKPTDRVTVNYEGRLIDGTVFDSSYKRGQPATFPLNGVIKGWTEALQLMPVGSKFRIWLPPELAYGEQGAGSRIGPNQALVFDVELLGIEGKTKPAAKAGK